MSVLMDPSNEEVRTIFILGFPPDVKERELQNLLRWWPGYEASQMNFKSDQPMGFALFTTASLAMAARDALQNLIFDSEKNSVLRAEMAKKNLYVKRGVVTNPSELTPYYDPSKRMRTAGDYSSPYPQPAGFITSSWTPQSYSPSPAPFEHYSGFAVSPSVPISTNIIPATNYASYKPQNNKDNPPCNTLFIGNLGEHTVEAEVRSLFATQPGFRQMKLLRQGKSTVCFVEMQDIPSAVNVHSSMQGAILTSSDRGGIRIQFSKNPFGKKREGSTDNILGNPSQEIQVLSLPPPPEIAPLPGPPSATA